MEMFDHLLAAFFGERGHGHADNLAVVHGVEAEIGGADGFLDAAERRGVERLDGDELWLGSMYSRDLVQWHQFAVIIDPDSVHHVDGGAAGTSGGHLATEVFDRFVHAGLQLYVGVLQGGIRCHGGLRHIVQLRKELDVKTVDYKLLNEDRRTYRGGQIAKVRLQR